MSGLTKRSRPAWARPLIEEPLPEPTEDGPSASDKTTSPVFAICLALLAVVGLGTQVLGSLSPAPMLITICVLWVLTIILLALQPPRTTPVLIFWLDTAILALQLTAFVRKWEAIDQDLLTPFAISGIVSLASCTLSLILIINMPMRDPRLPRHDIARVFAAPSNKKRSPEDSMTLWQWASVTWLSPMLSIARMRDHADGQLETEDIWDLPYTFQHRPLWEAFKPIKGTVFWRCFWACRADITILCVLSLTEIATKYAVPVLLQPLLLALQDNTTKRPAVIWTMVILLVKMVKTQSEVFSLWYGRRAYERARGAMMVMVYDKALRRQIITSIPSQDEAKDKTKASPDGTAPMDPEEDEDEDDESQPLLLSGMVEEAPKTPLARLKAFLLGWAKTLFPAFFPETKKLPADTGKLFNVVKSDCYEIAQRFWELQSYFEKPIGLAVSLTLCNRFLGWATWVGVAFSLVMTGINIALTALLIHYQKIRKDATDKKLQTIQQYVEALRHLRWYGWQDQWSKQVIESRQIELNKVNITRVIIIVMWMFNIAGTFGLPIVVFWAYTSLAHQILTVDVAFPALELLSFLQEDLRNVPDLITEWLEGRVALGRIGEFMSEPDLKHQETVGDELALRKATFAWPINHLADKEKDSAQKADNKENERRSVLSDVSLSFGPGMSVIFGKIAGGKSALMQGLLGELDLISGELIKPKKTIAYCQQSAWLQSMSLRDNILFGSPYDEKRYKQVLDACALMIDFAEMKSGDLTLVGENGVRLSGGQRARTALARALYSRAEFLLLDDPLSALDQSTAESVVEKCFNGPLIEGRTVILVTHRTDLVRSIATQWIEVEDRTVRVVDSPGHFEETDLQHSNMNDVLKSVVEKTKDTESPEAKKSQEEAAVRQKAADEEIREKGSAPFSLYWDYITTGGLYLWAMIIFTSLGYRAVRTAETWLLKEWTEAYGRDVEFSSIFSQLFTSQDLASRLPSAGALHAATSKVLPTIASDSSRSWFSRIFDDFPNPADNPNPWLKAYVAIIAGFVFFQVLQEAIIFLIMYLTGKRLFLRVLDQITTCTFSFYDTNPTSRIQSRMAGDMGQIDGVIARQIHMFAFFALAAIVTIVLVASVTWYFFILSVLLSIAFVSVYRTFIATSQNLRRMEHVLLAPVLQNFTVLGEGLVTMRAFQAQENAMTRCLKDIDAFQAMDHFYWSAQAWLSLRYGLLASGSTAILTFMAIASNLSVGLTAFVLVTSDKFVQVVHYLCRFYGELQMSMVAVERVVDVHAVREDAGDVMPPAHWPSTSDDIVFDNVVVRYAPHLDPVLKNMSFTLKGGSTVALVGRTGSGKSTVVLALLSAIAPESGRVTIGGIDLGRVNKQELRSRITFIPQDPVLFEGTLRQNMDPIDAYSEMECQSVLAQIGGKFGWKCDTKVAAGGKNLSQGQRQLVGMARAILRRSTICIMDEASASIDKETALQNMRIMREAMQGSTIITIAHKPEAVEGVNWFLQLSAGEVVAQGQPDDLKIVAEDSSEGEGEGKGEGSSSSSKRASK